MCIFKCTFGSFQSVYAVYRYRTVVERRVSKGLTVRTGYNRRGVILDRVSFHGHFVHFHLPSFLHTGSPGLLLGRLLPSLLLHALRLLD